MRIIEARGKIKDIKDTRNVAKKIGGQFKGSYYAIDIIFKSKRAEKGIIDLREFKINNRKTKNYILTHKIAEWSDKTKKDKIVLKDSFESMGQALAFMIVHYGEDLKEDYRYYREGWEYHLKKGDIFIEVIEKLGPTIEIEADNTNDLEELFKFFEVTERFSESTPEIMRKLLGK